MKIRTSPIRRTVLATAVAAVAVVLVPAALAQYPVGSGTLTASPSDVSPGGTVSVSGGGFAPGGAVSIYFRSVLLTTVSADSTGRITADVTIPRDAVAGTHTLEARGPAAGGGTAILTSTIEVLGAEASGLPDTGLAVLPFLVAGAAAVGAGATLVAVARRARKRS